VIYEASTIAVVFFFVFVGLTLGLSFYLGGKAKSSEGYFAAHGQIPWFVNGIAFAGDYLSAASFLGICGMIAFYGYDGFLYSIGFLAGWVVALFVIAEPMKRMGKYTFADALDSTFQSRGIKLAAGISTLVVSVFYLIPQMVGAGVLVQPLLGFDHWVGVVIVGVTVILIVVTAGMVSTTWVQFIKGLLLVVFSAILTVMILMRGFEVPITKVEMRHHDAVALPESGQIEDAEWGSIPLGEVGFYLSKKPSVVLTEGDHWYVWFTEMNTRENHVWRVDRLENDPGKVRLSPALLIAEDFNGEKLLNGQPIDPHANDRLDSPIDRIERDINPKRRAGPPPVGRILRLPNGEKKTGPLGPVEFLRTLRNSEVETWRSEKIQDPKYGSTTAYFARRTPGSSVLRPGEHPRFKGIRSDDPLAKLNFLSLMLALFCGTASLPHILIRYYTVKDAAAARKSTIVGIACIGFFYVLTLYMGLGAMTSGAMDVTNSNMAAPLLALSMNEWLFAAISAIAFTTVLGTVSGLILASAGAVTHDLLTSAFGMKLNDHEKVKVAKIASVVVGAIAIVLGIVFRELNVGYLVGWAFSVAASANLPSLVMLLFWKGTTKQGIIAAIVVGMVSSLGWILLSADTFEKVYGLAGSDALVPFSQPGIVTIPLGFATLVVVSLMTRREAS
jgi:cation/acetate symporter